MRNGSGEGPKLQNADFLKGVHQPRRELSWLGRTDVAYRPCRGRRVARPATIPGLAQFAEEKRAPARTVVIDAAFRIARDGGPGLAAIVINAALRIARDGGLGLAAIVIRAPATPLPPFLAQFREFPLAAVEEGFGLVRSRDGAHRQQGKQAKN